MATDRASGLRIGFFGTPEFASHILEHLLAHGENIAVVVTTPDKPQGRGLKMRSSAVKEVATAHAIPVLTPTKHKDREFLSALESYTCDLFLVVAYKILPREVYSMPRLGSFNVHGSLLPKYRGAAPINWAIMRGDTETGITTFLLDDQIDTGKMLIKRATPIDPEETAGELHDRLMQIGAEVALETVRGLASGLLTAEEQSNAGATTAPKIFPKDCTIDTSHPAEQLHSFIRGLSPYPGATITAPDGTRLKVLRATIAEHEPVLAPGEWRVSEDGKSLYLGTATSPLRILQAQREGKRAMMTDELLRGNRALFSQSAQNAATK